MGKIVFSLMTAATLALSSAGCGNSNGLYPVSGKVLYKGEPAKGAAVYFHRKKGTDPPQTHTPQGVVQEDGTFTLASPIGNGALPGEYVVLIEWKKGAGKVRGRSPALTTPDRLRGGYMNPNRSPFQVEVKTKHNHLPPFELR